MRYHHIGAAFCLSMAVAGQDCTFKYDGIDSFTGMHVVEAQAMIAEAPGPKAWLIYTLQDSAYTLDFSLSVEAMMMLVIYEGDRLMLKLSNDEVLTLSSLGGYQGVCMHLEGVNTSAIRAGYTITGTQLRSLAKYPVAEVRLYHGRDYVEFPTHHRHAKPSRQMAECFLTRVTDQGITLR